MSAPAMQGMIAEAELAQRAFRNELIKLPTRPPRWRVDPTMPRFRRDGGAFIVDGFTPDNVSDRNERLAYLMAHDRPFRMVNGQLIPGPHRYEESQEEQLARDLRELMMIERGEWKPRMRELDLASLPKMAEGTYGALGAYPLAAELASLTPTAATETVILSSAANAAIYMPVPQNGLLAPQAYRFMIGGRVTTSATAGNVTWTVRLGNANTSPSLGASLALAKTISITNAIFIIKGDITIQSLGGPGTNAKAVGHFDAKLNSAAGGAYISWAWGSTASASFDSTVVPNNLNGGSLWLGLTESAGPSPWTVGGVHYMDWN